ncbi:MAG TPA: PAS domain S-box protein [Terriglobia bacterium]|nr:PAS domain S-box protein [Terriglobia bacterium]
MFAASKQSSLPLLAAALSLPAEPTTVSEPTIDTSKLPGPRKSLTVRLLLFGLGYIGLFLALDQTSTHFQVWVGVSAWYLPAALTVALLVAGGVRAAPLALVAILAGARFDYHARLDSWGFFPESLGGLLSYLGAALLLRRAALMDLQFRRLAGVARFLLLTLVAGVGGAAVGALGAVLDGRVPRHNFGLAAFHWWLGDAVAIAALTPFLLVFIAPRLRPWVEGAAEDSPDALTARRGLDLPGPSELAEWTLQLTSIGLAIWLVIVFRPVALFDPLYALFIPLIWIAVRHGLRGAILGSLVLNAGVMMALHGPHVQPDSMPRIQLVILTVSVTALFLGIVVSERRYAERAWRESKESLRSESQLLESVLNSVGEAVVVVDAHGRYLQWNPAAERILGLWTVDAWPRPEHQGLYLPDGVTPFPQEELPWSRAVRGESTDQVEILVRTRQKKLWTSVTGRPIKDREGTVCGGVAVFRDISLRKLAEEEYRSAQERLNGLYSCSLDAMGYAALDGTLLDVNEAFLKLTGYSREELIARKKHQDLTPPEYAEHETELLNRLIATGEPQEYEKECARKDGSRAAVLMAAFAVKGKDGRPSGVGTVIKDVTERKKAEALRAGQSRVLEMIATNVPLGEMLSCLAEVIESQCPGMLCSVLLLDSAGQRLLHGAAPSLPPGCVQALDGLQIGPQAGCCGAAAWRGEPVIVRDIQEDPLCADYRSLAAQYGLRACWSTPIKSHEGKVVGTFATYYREARVPGPSEIQLIDIATRLAGIGIERKRAEEALRESEERFSKAFRASPAAVTISTLIDGRYLDVNASFQKLLGYSREELLGQSAAELVWPAKSDRAAFVETLRRHEVVREMEVRLRTKSGETRDVLISAEQLHLRDETCVLSITQDVTERKRAEEALRRSEAELKDAQRVAQVGSWSWSLETGAITWSDELYRIAGLDPSQPPPSYEEFSRFYSPESWQRLRQAVQETIRTGDPYELEVERVRPDGDTCWVQVRGTPVRNGDGRVVALHGTSQDITERKRHEEALRQSEERFSKAFRLSPAAVSISTLREGRYLDINESCTRILGYTREELVGRRAPDMIWERPEDRVAFVERLREQKFVREMEARLRTKLGETRDVLLSAELIQIGGEECILIITDDVTERKRSEETLRQLSLQKQLILSSAGEGIFGLNLQGRVMFINPAGARMLGWEPLELIGRIQHERVHHSHADGTPYAQEECPIYAAFRDGEVRRLDTEVFWRKDGTSFPVEYISTPIREGGQVVGAVVTFRDITERQKAEEALRSSEVRFRRVFSSAPLPMWLWDTDTWRFLEVNESATAHYGYSREEFLAMQVTDILPPQEAERMKSDYQRRTDGRYLVETRQRVKDGSFIDVHLTSELVELGGRRVRLVVAEDISERKRAEEALHQRTMELERSNADLEQFAYVASHDLQEPLRMVASFTQLLADRYGTQLDDEAREFIGFALEGATRMQALIGGLLSFARVKTRAKELQPMDCQAAFQRTLGSFRVTLQETGAEVSAEGLPTVLADQSQIEQLFQNLIGNALKFRSQDTPRIRISAQRNGKEWIFSVSDNGIGIDPRYRERIFAIFQRLHSRNEYPGTGIGLAICKKIVERHGGRIWVESEAGHGATFHFTLPIVEGMPA